MIHTVAAAVGLSALLLTSALAFSVVKYLGAGYLIFLGLRTLLAREKSVQTTVIQVPKSSSRLFAQGFLMNLLNSKTALFFYAFLPQFVNPARGAAIAQILLLRGIFVLIAFCTDGLQALLSSQIGEMLSRNGYIRRMQRYVTGCVYIVLGITTAIAGSEKR